MFKFVYQSEYILDILYMVIFSVQGPSCQIGYQGPKGRCIFSLACTYGGGRHLGICRDR